MTHKGKDSTHFCVTVNFSENVGDVGNGAPQACDIPMAIGPLKTRVPSLCVK